MAGTIFSAIITCIASLFLGQAALRLAGAREWSWLAPPVGISVAMVIALPAMSVPGRCTTIAIVLAALTLAAIVWCGLAPPHRPPLGGLLAAAPVAVLLFVPFLACGHFGILGTSWNNDMAIHMLMVEGYLSDVVATVTPVASDYPLGPHAMVAAISRGSGISVEQAFAGWTMAVPVLTAWTTLALVRRSAWLKQAAAATVVALPFLIAAYYGQGSFKELLQAGLVLAFALLLSGCGPQLGRGRWVPHAVLIAGMVSVYSITGLPWPLFFLALWLGGNLALRVRRQGLGGLRQTIVAELPSIGIGLAVLVAALLPQVGRIADYLSKRSGTGIPVSEIGNLLGPLPGWEALGVWDKADFRYTASAAFTGGFWSIFVLALFALGAVWAFRRGRWMLPLAAAAAMLIWAVSNHSQSPYVSAKGLAIASPLILAVAVFPLAEGGERPRGRLRASLFRRPPGRPLSWALASFLALVLVVRVGISDVEALRASPVGPTSHLEQLKSLRSSLQGGRLLFLGVDDLVYWELAGVGVGAPVIGGSALLPLRPQKEWETGEPLDFDSVDAATINSYDWVITTRDAAGSARPPGLRLVLTTPDYALWHRVRPVRERSILDEGEMPGAVLDCRRPAGRAALRAGGVAAVRAQPIVHKGFWVPPGEEVSVRLPLAPGEWELEAAYASRFPIEVSAPGLRYELPASLDRVGPRWPLGRVRGAGARGLAVRLEAKSPWLAPGSAAAEVDQLVATPVAPERVVPIRAACGRYVDWYRAADR